MNINIKNNKIILENFTGTVIVNEDDNTISLLNVVLKEPEESKSVSEYCKAISVQAHEIMLLKKDIKEFELREKHMKDRIDYLENELNQARLYSDEPETEEEILQDYINIPEIAAPLPIEAPEVVTEINIPEGNYISEIVRFKKEKTVRPIPEEKRKNIEDGIIKFFKSRGKKTSFKYNFGQASKPESIKEAKEIQSLCQTTNHNFIKQIFKNMLSSGRIMETGVQKKRDGSFGGGRFVLYSLNDLEYSKPKSLCPKCGGFSLVKNENKYSSNEDYYYDKDGHYFTCLSCGEEVVVEEKEAA